MGLTLESIAERPKTSSKSRNLQRLAYRTASSAKSRDSSFGGSLRDVALNYNSNRPVLDCHIKGYKMPLTKSR